MLQHCGPMSTACVRPMTEEDIPSVLELDRVLVGEKRLPTYADPLESYVGGTLSASCVAEVEGKVVGFVLCRVGESGLSGLNTAVIDMMGVHPDAQRKGVGTSLVSGLMQRCREQRIRQVTVIADRRDDVLRSFLASLGFRQGDRVDYSVSLGP